MSVGPGLPDTPIGGGAVRRKETRTMDILAGRLTRAMRADMADNEARLVSLAGERFSQSAMEEVGTYDIDNLRARAEAAEAEVARLTAWLMEADSAFNLDGAQSTNLDECAGLVRMCCEGRAAIDQVARLREALRTITDRYEFICTNCDDGWAGHDDWSAIADAKELIARAATAEANAKRLALTVALQLAEIEAIRTALGGYRDSDLVSPATTLNARNEAAEAEVERLREALELAAHFVAKARAE